MHNTRFKARANICERKSEFYRKILILISNPSLLYLPLKSDAIVI